MESTSKKKRGQRATEETPRPAEEVLTLRHGEGEFYALLGPFFCSKAVHKEMGEPLASDGTMTWFVAVGPPGEGEGGAPGDAGREVLGFCTLRETEDSYWLDYSYTAPAHRRRGVQTRLEAVRDAHLAALPAKALRVSCRSHNWAHWKARGFEVASQRGDWFFGAKGAPGKVEKAKAKRTKGEKE